MFEMWMLIDSISEKTNATKSRNQEKLDGTKKF